MEAQKSKRGSNDPPNNERSKVRLSLDISPELNALLERLATTERQELTS